MPAVFLFPSNQERGDLKRSRWETWPVPIRDCGVHYPIGKEANVAIYEDRMQREHADF